MNVAVTVRDPLVSACPSVALALPPLTATFTALPSKVNSTVPAGLALLPVVATSAVTSGAAPYSTGLVTDRVIAVGALTTATESMSAGSEPCCRHVTVCVVTRPPVVL